MIEKWITNILLFMGGFCYFICLACILIFGVPAIILIPVLGFAYLANWCDSHGFCVGWLILGIAFMIYSIMAIIVYKTKDKLTQFK